MSFIQALIGSITSAGGGVPLDITCTGGTRNEVGIYSYHTWLSNNTFTLNTAADRDIEWCLMGGGATAARNAGGTTSPGGGGGAGEQVTGTYSSMPAGTWNAVIGAGAATITNPVPQTWMYGSPGSLSSSSQTSGSGGDDLEANGGGGGQSVQVSWNWYHGQNGGCGGGASGAYGNAGNGGAINSYDSSNPAWTSASGNVGGDGSYNSLGHGAAGGGGGIGSAGSHASNRWPWNFYTSPISSGAAGHGATHPLTTGSSTVASTTGVGGAGAGGSVGATAPSGVAADMTFGNPTSAAPANSGSGSSSAQQTGDVGAGGSGYMIIRWVTLV